MPPIYVPVAALIDATDGALLVHDPPVGKPARVAVPPEAQTVVVPVMADARVLMVTGSVT